jgi:hypothetical protein
VLDTCIFVAGTGAWFVGMVFVWGISQCRWSRQFAGAGLSLQDALAIIMPARFHVY